MNPIKELLRTENHDGSLASGAVFSSDRLYRYALWRTWSFAHPRFVVIGLNPSTADAQLDDPTIRRCVSFAKREHCGGLIMLNLFAFRSTDPKRMFAAVDPIGPANDAAIRNLTNDPNYTIVAAWGTHGTPERVAEVKAIVGRLWCFGRNADGSPKHPLYLKKTTLLEPYHGVQVPVGILNAETTP